MKSIIAVVGIVGALHVHGAAAQDPVDRALGTAERAQPLPFVVRKQGPVDGGDARRHANASLALPYPSSSELKNVYLNASSVKFCALLKDLRSIQLLLHRTILYQSV